MRLRFFASIGCLVLLVAPLPGAALVIDDFEVGDFTVTDDTSAGAATLGEQSGLPGSNVRGGVRLVRIAASGSDTFATASLTTTAADDAAALSVIGTLNPFGDFEFIYDGIANGVLDGTGGSLNLDLTPFESIQVGVQGTSAAATLRLRLWTSTAAVTSSDLPATAGVHEFDLGEFSALDLTDVQAIRLSVLQVTLLDAPLLVDIRAVPEPGSVLLLGGGLLAVAARRRASRG